MLIFDRFYCNHVILQIPNFRYFLVLLQFSVISVSKIPTSVSALWNTTVSVSGSVTYPSLVHGDLILRAKQNPRICVIYCITLCYRMLRWTNVCGNKLNLSWRIEQQFICNVLHSTILNVCILKYSEQVNGWTGSADVGYTFILVVITTLQNQLSGEVNVTFRVECSFSGSDVWTKMFSIQSGTSGCQLPSP